MQLDLEYLRQHYAALSDEGLLDIERADLVPAAQSIFDREVASRNLVRPRGAGRAQPAVPRDDEVDVESENSDGEELEGESFTPEDEPDWLEDAAEAFSFASMPGREPAPDVASARDALVAAGIPCYLDLQEIPSPIASTVPKHRWRLMVPGDLAFRATGILECEIANPEFEADWKTHLKALSDDELRAMTPKVAFCGLFDRIERVNRIYDEEIARRRLK